MHSITSLKQITYDPETKDFYILANKFEQKLGIFLVKINEDEYQNATFQMQLKNKLDIGDANLTLSINKDTNLKELVMSYKSVYLNTYSVTVFDLCVTN